MRSDFTFILPLDARWGDMDARRHVNNAAYFTYCESARLRYFEELEFATFSENGAYGSALVSATCNFRRQLVAPARIEIGVRISELRARSFSSLYELYLEGETEPFADGSAVSVWMHYGENKAYPLPEGLRRTIRRWEGGKLVVAE